MSNGPDFIVVHIACTNSYALRAEQRRYAALKLDRPKGPKHTEPFWTKKRRNK